MCFGDTDIWSSSSINLLKDNWKAVGCVFRPQITVVFLEGQRWRIVSVIRIHTNTVHFGLVVLRIRIANKQTWLWDTALIHQNTYRHLINLMRSNWSSPLICKLFSFEKHRRFSQHGWKNEFELEWFRRHYKQYFWPLPSVIAPTLLMWLWPVRMDNNNSSCVQPNLHRNVTEEQTQKSADQYARN